MPTVTLGIEQFLAHPPAWARTSRLGLLCNQASTDSRFRHSRDLLRERCGANLVCLFTPQHGFFAEKQDNMVESLHMRDAATGLPVYSLYGESRRPSREMLETIDVLLVDLQDVGTRVYTFLYTMAYCLEVAAETGRKVVVLDRPNPVGGRMVEGNILRQDCRSFVGLYPLPMRHGLTMGELALLLNSRFGIGAELEVVRMGGWRREMFFPDTGLPWVYPSPNMPAFATALVYPGQVIWEGTNLSEGRGTTLPFELCGAPFLDHREILAELARTELPGCYFRPVVFEPTSGKWAGQACRGFHLHVTERAAFFPYRTALALFQAVYRRYPGAFQYKEPPYEYEFERLPMDLILGDSAVRTRLEAGEEILSLEKSWCGELREYDALRREVFLYE